MLTCLNPPEQPASARHVSKCSPWTGSAQMKLAHTAVNTSMHECALLVREIHIQINVDVPSPAFAIRSGLTNKYSINQI